MKMKFGGSDFLGKRERKRERIEIQYSDIPKYATKVYVSSYFYCIF